MRASASISPAIAVKPSASSSSRYANYNLGNFLRTLATPELIKDWSLTSLKEKLIKIGAKVVSHGRYVAFQMAEVAIPRQMFQEILRWNYGRSHHQRPRDTPIITHSRAPDRRSASKCQRK